MELRLRVVEGVREYSVWEIRGRNKKVPAAVVSIDTADPAERKAAVTAMVESRRTARLSRGS